MKTNICILILVLLIGIIIGAISQGYLDYETLIRECKSSYLYGKQSQIEDNINHQVMNCNGKWLNEFKLAGDE